MRNARLGQALLFALLPLPATAAEEPRLHEVRHACEPVSAIEARIYYCSENDQAVRAARACRDALRKLWGEAPRDLTPVLASTRAWDPGGQEDKFRNSTSDYSNARQKLANLVRVTEENGDVVAGYAPLLVDVPPAGLDRSLSEPCYSERFAELQEQIFAIDDMILEGRAARDRAEGLRASTDGRDALVDSTTANTVLRAGAPALGAGLPVAPVPRGGSPRSASDITGTERTAQRQAQEEALMSFPLRDQLTGP